MNKNSKQQVVEVKPKSIYDNSGALPNVRYDNFICKKVNYLSFNIFLF